MDSKMGHVPVVYVLDPYHEDAITKLQSQGDLTVILPGDPRAKTYHTDATYILVRSETTIGEAELLQARNLRAIIKQGAGVDNIDLQAAQRHGVIVCNTPGINSEAVAELTLTLALSIARRVCEIDRRVRNGEKVVRSQTLGHSLFRKTMGVVGVGNIGRVIARKWAGAMEGRVVAYDPYAPESAWDEMKDVQRASQIGELLEQADVVSLHVPLTEKTRGLIGKDEFAMMKSNAILINCARGGIVDEGALLDALDKRQILGAGLDAMEVEPPSLEKYGDTLLRHPGVIMTPHIGASTIENQSRSGIAAVDTLCSLIRGEEVTGRLV
ncbi:D-isomer specific 2-hydroxyacid dehydrogenase, NAD binding domain-containing protein [Cladophialophora immunda]|nr:D-isomer specific 2-hydroxyacid dehydrogenase, NAD binding domain-containing protein [Cladophialophora immunda]